MSVLVLIVLLLVLAAVLWLVNVKGAAMNATIKTIINIVVITLAVLLVLSAFGVWDQVKSIQVPKL